MYAVIAVFSTVLGASIVVSIEQTIQQNNQQETLGDWTFGQALAIFTAIYGAVQALSDCKGYWPDIRKSKNKGQLTHGLMYASHRVNTEILSGCWQFSPQSVRSGSLTNRNLGRRCVESTETESLNTALPAACQMDERGDCTQCSAPDNSTLNV